MKKMKPKIQTCSKLFSTGFKYCSGARDGYQAKKLDATKLAGKMKQTTLWKGNGFWVALLIFGLVATSFFILSNAVFANSENSSEITGLDFYGICTAIWNQLKSNQSNENFDVCEFIENHDWGIECDEMFDICFDLGINLSDLGNTSIDINVTTNETDPETNESDDNYDGNETDDGNWTDDVDGNETDNGNWTDDVDGNETDNGNWTDDVDGNETDDAIDCSEFGDYENLNQLCIFLEENNYPFSCEEVLWACNFTRPGKGRGGGGSDNEKEEKPEEDPKKAETPKPLPKPKEEPVVNKPTDNLGQQIKEINMERKEMIKELLGEGATDEEILAVNEAMNAMKKDLINDFKEEQRKEIVNEILTRYNCEKRNEKAKEIDIDKNMLKDELDVPEAENLIEAIPQDFADNIFLIIKEGSEEEKINIKEQIKKFAEEADKEINIDLDKISQQLDKGSVSAILE